MPVSGRTSLKRTGLAIVYSKKLVVKAKPVSSRDEGRKERRLPGRLKNNGAHYIVRIDDGTDRCF
jgi:hypothetical protein